MSYIARSLVLTTSQQFRARFKCPPNFTRVQNGKSVWPSTPSLIQRPFSSIKKETVKINFTLRNGQVTTANAKIGDNLLDVVIDNHVDIDGYGACEGTLACSTCHLIFKPEDYKKIGNVPSDEELDMLDLAYGLTNTSRLGCQVIVTKEMAGWTIQVPSSVADAREV